MSDIKTPEQILISYLYNRLNKLFDGVALFYEHKSEREPGTSWAQDNFYFLPNGFTYFIDAESNLELRQGGRVFFCLRKADSPIATGTTAHHIETAPILMIPEPYSLENAFLYCVQKEIKHRADQLRGESEG